MGPIDIRFVSTLPGHFRNISTARTILAIVLYAASAVSFFLVSQLGLWSLFVPSRLPGLAWYEKLLLFPAAVTIAFGFFKAGAWLHNRNTPTWRGVQLHVGKDGFQIIRKHGLSHTFHWESFSRLRNGDDFLLLAGKDGGSMDISFLGDSVGSHKSALAASFEHAAKRAGVEVLP